MLALVFTILLALFVPPYVNLKRFRASLETSLGRALDRRVTIGSVHLRLLPRPGFDFSDFKVFDDPSISNEPMLRADSVTASLRLTSLWRGRLEIASLSLSDVSLNVVRAADGRWNLEGLLARASQVPTAPTARTRAEGRPRFPYIEADRGRINFKLGEEKKAFTLVDAEFSLWLAQEDEWNLALKARPVRTDFNLSDTGRLRLSGTVRRAASVRDTPVNLRLTLERAQLGQLTTLIYDRDRGWRGTTNATAVLSGTPGQLQLVLDAGVDDFRRYDIMTGGAYGLRARCTGNYSVDTAVLSGILCNLPAGDGVVTLRGQVTHPFAGRQYDISIAAKDVAVQELVRFAQHAKRDLPLDLAADGTVDAAFTLQPQPEDPSRRQSWAGGGSTNRMVLRSRTFGSPLALGSIQFSLQPAANPKGRRPQPASLTAPLQLALEPFEVDLGARAPATVRGIVTRADYALAVQGDADVARLLDVAQGLGIPAPPHAVTGAAHLDLQIQGTWAGFAAPLPIGNVQVRNATLTLPAANAPLRASSALISLAPDQSSITVASAAFEGFRGTLDGSVQLPRRCDFGPQCLLRFDLRADELSTDELNRLFNPGLRRRAWYQFGSGGPSGLRKLHAEGHIAAGKLQIKTVIANHASADVKLADGRLELSNARADVLGGKYQGRWLADFSGNLPSYSGQGTLDGASLAQLSVLMHDNWAAGTAQISYQANLAGANAADLVESLTAKLDFQWRDGILRHVALRGAEPLRFSRFRGHAELDDGKLTFSNSSMDAASGIYQLDGTASLGRELDVKLAPKSGPAIAIDGTLQKPRIAARPAASPVALKQ
jgi:AsmA-like C-terminal region/AsmA family